jgi:hypothetical protein
MIKPFKIYGQVTYLTKEEAAAYLGITKKALGSLRWSKKGPAAMPKCPTHLVYDLRSLQAWARKHNWPTPPLPETVNVAGKKKAVS